MGLKMKNFFLVILFSCIPLSALSEVGDLYYCEMTQAVEIKKVSLLIIFPKNLNLELSKKT